MISIILSAYLKTIYLTPSEDAGKAALDEVSEKWSKVYPYAMKRWYDNWDVICPIFMYNMNMKKQPIL